MRVEEYAYYVNKLRLKTWKWRRTVTLQKVHTKYKWPPYATEWNPPMKVFCVPHWIQTIFDPNLFAFFWAVKYHLANWRLINYCEELSIPSDLWLKHFRLNTFCLNTLLRANLLINEDTKMYSVDSKRMITNHPQNLPALMSSSEQSTSDGIFLQTDRANNFKSKL